MDRLTDHETANSNPITETKQKQLPTQISDKNDKSKSISPQNPM